MAPAKVNSKPKNTAGKPAAKTTAKEMLQSYGKVISAPELRAFQDAGFSASRAKTFAQNQPDVSLSSFAAKSAFGKPGTTSPSTSTAASTTQSSVASPAESNIFSADEMMSFLEAQSLQEQTIAGLDSSTRITLGNLDADARKEAARLAADADKEVARIASGAQIQSTGISAEATKYVSDREKEAILQRAEIESRGRLDLQSIINAGLKTVAEVEGLTARDVATIGGRYGVEQEQARQSGQKEIARIAGRTGILQGLVGAFNF
jgi:hypothetical protein